MTLIFLRDIPGLEQRQVFSAIFVIWTSTAISGNNFQFIPDIGKAKSSAAKIFTILDSEDEDQIQEKGNSKRLKSGIEGNISIENVSFKYPSRNNPVLSGLNVQVNCLQKIGLTGSSGCGKSTIIKLLLRFYDAGEGKILIDGIDIMDYDIHYLRSCFSVVGQEPTLFNASICENIRYNSVASDEEILTIAQASNCLEFISSEKDIGV